MNAMPAYDPIPAWYEISSREDGKALVLEVHPLALMEMEKIEWDKSPLLPHMKEEYGLSKFTPPRNGDCGFSEVFKSAEPNNDGWIAWSVALPVYKASEGSTESHDGYAIAVRTTLQVFSNILWLFAGNTGYEHNQLIVIEAIVLPRKDEWVYGGALGVTLTPDAIKWLRKQPNEEDIGPVVEAMKNAYEHMWQTDSEYHRYRAICRSPKWIHLDIPGNACGLDPECNSSGQRDPDKGYQLVPHNTDTGLQQLTLLIGLAKLHDLIRGR